MRAPLDGFCAALLAALGLSPLACGGTVSGNGNPGESGGTAGAGGGPFGGGRAGNGGSSGGSQAFRPCTNPTPVLDGGGKPTGYVSCAPGNVHRATKEACASFLPRPETCPGATLVDGGLPTYACLTDADCTAQAHGYCSTPSYGPVSYPGCTCNYGCVSDADCGTGMICVCGNPVGYCAPATCTEDSDCSGGLCLSYTADPGCGGTAFSCQTPKDSCVGDADCPSGQQCSNGSGAGPHQCQSPTCAIGRPFLVGNAARLAPEARRADWCSSLSPSVAGLDATSRRALATRWTEIGLMEHASIAAFARFALELLSLGAPPELLTATHAAMADETVHARDAFALASAYAGSDVGPGALDVDRALASRSPMDIVRTAILEGCIGETVAAVEAAEALAHATDPAVREVLVRVTLDEARHAELAWRFLQWAIERGAAGPQKEVATLLTRLVALERTASAAPSSPHEEQHALLPAHGVISERARADIRRRVLADVVAPCARALALGRSERYFAPSGELMKNST